MGSGKLRVYFVLRLTRKYQLRVYGSDCPLLRNALQTILNFIATGCYCHAETISAVSSMCAVQAEAVPAVKGRQRREMCPLGLRRLHLRAVENSILRKMPINSARPHTDVVARAMTVTYFFTAPKWQLRPQGRLLKQMWTRPIWKRRTMK